MNKSQVYRFKTQLNELIEMKKPKLLSNKVDKWIKTLRMSKSCIRNVLGMKRETTNLRNQCECDNNTQARRIEFIRPCYLEKSLQSFDKYINSVEKKY